MRTIIVLFAIIGFMVSCGEPRKPAPPLKYSVGDILYLKLDTTQCIVTETYSMETYYTHNYRIKYKTGKGEYKEIAVKQAELFKKSIYD